jgi:hypothetical protein
MVFSNFWPPEELDMQTVDKQKSHLLSSSRHCSASEAVGLLTMRCTARRMLRR